MTTSTHIRDLMVAALPADKPRDPHDALRQFARIETEIAWLLVQRLDITEHRAALSRLAELVPFSNIEVDITARWRAINRFYHQLHLEAAVVNDPAGIKLLNVVRAETEGA